MHCFKYVVTSACGHNGQDNFVHCKGGHTDNPTENETCYKSSVSYGSMINVLTVCMGSSYCSKACMAASVGWNCCTCNFQLVNGVVNPHTGIPMHESPNGLLHALCSLCTDAVEPMISLKAELDIVRESVGDAGSQSYSCSNSPVSDAQGYGTGFTPNDATTAAKMLENTIHTVRTISSRVRNMHPWKTWN